MDAFRVGLAIPLQGPGGIYGPSYEKVAEMAAAQLNLRNGILGRKVEIELLDAGMPLDDFYNHTGAAVSRGRIQAVVGWHMSTVRQKLGPLLAKLGAPFVYTAVHEGAGRDEAVLCPGETPSMQVRPGLRWLRENLGIRRWVVIGDDYVWPRATVREIHAYADETDLEILHEQFVDYGCRDYRNVLEILRDSNAEGVIMLLVGRDAVMFNRQFAARGLDEQLVRFSPLMDENMLLASGAGTTRDLYAAAAYFNSLVTSPAMDFTGEYADMFGPHAPALNNAAESSLEGILTLAASTTAVGSTDPAKIMNAIEERGVSYDGPRGTVRLGAGSAHQQVYMARANNYEFDVLGALS